MFTISEWVKNKISDVPWVSVRHLSAEYRKLIYLFSDVCSDNVYEDNESYSSEEIIFSIDKKPLTMVNKNLKDLTESIQTWSDSFSDIEIRFNIIIRDKLQFCLL